MHTSELELSSLRFVIIDSSPPSTFIHLFCVVVLLQLTSSIKENPRLRAAAEELRKQGVKIGDAVSDALKTMEESDIVRAVSLSALLWCLVPSNISGTRRFQEHPLRYRLPLPVQLNPFGIQLHIKLCPRQFWTPWTIAVALDMVGTRRRKSGANGGRNG